MKSRYLIWLLLFLSLPQPGVSQKGSLIKEIKKTGKEFGNLSKEVIGLGKDANDVVKSLKKKNSGEKTSPSLKKRPLYSDLENEEFYQIPGKKNEDPNKTRVKLVGNILIDIEGNYPAGYAPSWNIIKEFVATQFVSENLTVATLKPKMETIALKLAEDKGKAYVITKSYSIGGECYGEIVVKDEYTVISDTKQVYELANFKKIMNERFSEEPCFRSTSAKFPLKDYAGRISFDSDGDGNITSDFLLEINSEEIIIPRQYNKSTKKTEIDVRQPSQVISKYRYSNVLYANNMSAKKATEKENAELEAKKKYADYLKTSKVQVANLMKVIDKKYPGFDCETCYSRNSQYGTESYKTQTLWRDGSVSYGRDYSINNTMKLKNRCNQEIIFVGIRQLYSEEKGYYFEDVEKRWPANFYQESNEGLLMSIFTSMTGMDGDIRLSPDYNIESARVGSIQWIKVVGKSKANPK